MKRVGYDFITWVSFPSSIRVDNDTKEPAWLGRRIPESLSVIPRSKLKVAINAKQENVLYPVYGSHIHLEGFNGVEWLGSGALGLGWPFLSLPRGTFEWRTFEKEVIVPNSVVAIRLTYSGGGSGQPGKPGITWFDNLKICQDGVLIYDNYFTALRPGKVVPVVWTPPERIIGAWQRKKAGEKALIFKPPRLLQTIKA